MLEWNISFLREFNQKKNQFFYCNWKQTILDTLAALSSQTDKKKVFME